MKMREPPRLLPSKLPRRPQLSPSQQLSQSRRDPKPPSHPDRVIIQASMVSPVLIQEEAAAEAEVDSEVPEVETDAPDRKVEKAKVPEVVVVAAERDAQDPKVQLKAVKIDVPELKVEEAEAQDHQELKVKATEKRVELSIVKERKESTTKAELADSLASQERTGILLTERMALAEAEVNTKARLATERATGALLRMR